MTEIILTPETVRLALLAAQGLLSAPEAPAEKGDVLAAIRRMGALQIDTIHVVARSPYLVLFSRLGDYQASWLDELLAEGALFEYWSHAACLLPIEDYPLYANRMQYYAQNYFKHDWETNHSEGIERVLERIRSNGAVRSSDFERTDGQKGSWWNWKEEKLVLEYLHTSGQLMIARRDKFQRIYDLRERVLPGWDDSHAVPTEEAHKIQTVRAVRCLGAAPARWVPDYFRLPKKGIGERLEMLVAEGELLRARVEGWSEPVYYHPEQKDLIERAQAGALEPSLTTLLSPFDPLTWDRERARNLFDFDYTIECYTPEAKRVYGYFTLPILRRGRLIGRLDPKAHRKQGVFEIRGLHLEPGVEVTDALAEDVGAAIQRCADWHRTPRVEILKSSPVEAADKIRTYVRV
jgi:uncharacterized protein